MAQLSTPRHHPAQSGFSHSLPFPGERPAAPAAQHDDSEDAWAEFRQLHATHEARFADTQPMTRPQELRIEPARKPLSLLSLDVSLDEVIKFTRQRNRVCPRPQQWEALYRLLPPSKVASARWMPAPPVTGAAWHATSCMPKRIALREQVEWADHHGLLGTVYDFLQALDESEWLHMDD